MSHLRVGQERDEWGVRHQASLIPFVVVGWREGIARSLVCASLGHAQLGPSQTRSLMDRRPVAGDNLGIVEVTAQDCPGGVHSQRNTSLLWSGTQNSGIAAMERNNTSLKEFDKRIALFANAWEGRNFRCTSCSQKMVR